MTDAIVLASASAARQAMLAAAGVPFAADPPSEEVETAAKRRFGNPERDPEGYARALAWAKADAVAARHGGAITIGCDQIALADDGRVLGKPATPADAIAQLSRLSGRDHRLVSVVVAVRDGERLWHHADDAVLTMASLTPEFIADYVANHWGQIRHCVGCYRIEAEGARLFADVSGDRFTIQGLPLAPLLDFLRRQGVLAA